MKMPSNRTVVGAAAAVAFALSIVSLVLVTCTSTPADTQQRGFLSGGGSYLPGTSNTLPRLTNTGALVESGFQTISTTGTIDALAVSSGARTVLLSCAASCTLNGIAGGAIGRKLTVCNISTTQGTFLIPEALTAAATDRIRLTNTASQTLSASSSGSGCAEFIYKTHGATTRWWLHSIVSGALTVGTLTATTLLEGANNVPSHAGSCATGERLEWSGSAWECRAGVGDYRAPCYSFYEDFLSVSNTTDFINTNVGAGAAVTTAQGRSRFGIAELITGTTSTGSARRTGSANSIEMGQHASVDYAVTLGWPVLSTAAEAYFDIIGCANDFTTDPSPSNGCFFLADRENASGFNATNADKLITCCYASGIGTCVLLDGTTQGGIATVDTPIAALTLPNTNIYRLRIAVTGTASAAFSVNGTTRTTLTTNIPSAANATCGLGFSHVKTAGGTSRSLQVDAHDGRVCNAAPRSP